MFDAQFDTYRGVVAYVRIVDGALRSGMKFMSMAHKRVYEATEVGVFKPEMRKTDELMVGNVGYVIANIKSLGDMDVGDTITEPANPAQSRCPATNRSYRWCTAGSIPTKASRSRSCAMRSRSSRSTIRRSTSSPRARSRWASGSAAGSWASCTWRSCKSGSSATTTST